MDLQLTDNDLKLFKACRDRWGRDYELRKLVEELNEAGAVLSKFMNGETDYADVNQEIADVLIMIGQYCWQENQSHQVYTQIIVKQERAWREALKMRPEDVHLDVKDLV